MSTTRAIILILCALLGSPTVPMHDASAAGEPVATVRFFPELVVVERVGQEFTVACVVESAYNLTAVDITISWNTTLLNCADRTLTAPVEDYATAQTPSRHGGILHSPIMTLKDEVSTSAGTYHVALLTINGPSFNGSGTVFLMSFQVAHVPLSHEVEPLDYMDTQLWFESVDLAREPAAGGGSIPYYVVTGQVRILARFALHHDIGISRISTSKTGCLPLPTLGQGQAIDISMLVENQGNFTESFNLTVRVNATVIFTQLHIALAKQDSTTFTVTWNTTQWNKGYYHIEATVPLVQDEADIADNTLVEGPMMLTISGDADGDRRVTIFDIVRMASVYLVSSPSLRYDANSDLNNDETVDSQDLSIAVGEYGKSWSDV